MSDPIVDAILARCLDPDFTPEPEPPLAPGDHGHAAERARRLAIARLSAARMSLDMMMATIRNDADGDAMADLFGSNLLRELQEAGAMIELFRQTRDCEGEA